MVVDWDCNVTKHTSMLQTDELMNHMNGSPWQQSPRLTGTILCLSGF